MATVHVYPPPHIRQLDAKGVVTWHENWHCECCKTHFLTTAAPYRTCDGCGCYTTVYLRRYMLKEVREKLAYLNKDSIGYVTLCQECVRNG